MIFLKNIMNMVNKSSNMCDWYFVILNDADNGNGSSKAQGVMLDIDHTYPFVTSPCVAGGAQLFWAGPSKIGQKVVGK